MFKRRRTWTHKMYHLINSYLLRELKAGRSLFKCCTCDVLINAEIELSPMTELFLYVISTDILCPSVRHICPVKEIILFSNVKISSGKKPPNFCFQFLVRNKTHLAFLIFVKLK